MDIVISFNTAMALRDASHPIYIDGAIPRQHGVKRIMTADGTTH